MDILTSDTIDESIQHNVLSQSTPIQSAESESLTTTPFNIITSSLSAIVETINSKGNIVDESTGVEGTIIKIPIQTTTSKIIQKITTTTKTLIESTILNSNNNNNEATDSSSISATTLTSLSSSSSSSSSLSSLPIISEATATSTIGANKLNVNDLSSSLQLFSWADYLVFIIMLIVCAVIGIYFGFVEKSKQKNKMRGDGSGGIRVIEQRRGSEALDYLVGGRKMQVFPVSMSLVASFVSGISLLGTSTEIYVYGTQYAFLLVTIIFSGIISWHIFLPVFCNLQLTSTYEYFEMRFDRRIRLLGSVLFVAGTMLWLPIVIYVPALAFNQVTGINIHIITPAVCVVCIFYTCVGGLKAVVWTDVLQSFVMYGSMILVIVKGTMKVGGFGNVISLNYGSGRLEAPFITMDHTARYSIWSVFFGSTFHWLQNTCANQVMMQRFLAVPNLKKARQALIIFVIGIIILLSFCIYNGMLIYANYHQCDPLKTKLAKAHDQLVPLLVMDILGIFPGMPGLFVAGVFSAALSSLSTGLNSLTAVFLEDFVKPYKKKPLTEHQTAVFMKTAVVICGIVCVALVFVVEQLGMVLQLSATMGALTNGPLLGIFFIGVLIPWVNGKSALFGGLISFILMGYIAIRAQIDIKQGSLVFPTKPTSVEGCQYIHNYTSPIHSEDEFIDNLEKPFYHMSYMFYTICGCLTTIVCSCLSTFWFGYQNTEDMDPILVAPFLRKYIKNKVYHSIRPDIKEMETVIKAYDTESQNNIKNGESKLHD